MKLTLSQARRMLPNGYEGFAPEAVTVVALRDAVMQELEAFNEGQNPLTVTQIARFQQFLKATQ